MPILLIRWEEIVRGTLWFFVHRGIFGNGHFHIKIIIFLGSALYLIWTLWLACWSLLRSWSHQSPFSYNPLLIILINWLVLWWLHYHSFCPQGQLASYAIFFVLCNELLSLNFKSGLFIYSNYQIKSSSFREVTTCFFVRHSYVIYVEVKWLRYFHTIDLI